MYIARNVHMHDKHSKENVLSSKPQENERNSREKKKEATGVDSCGLSNHSFRSAELQQPANLNVPSSWQIEV